jgi:hypothetical protein
MQEDIEPISSTGNAERRCLTRVGSQSTTSRLLGPVATPTLYGTCVHQCNYSFYAPQVESLFLPNFFTALEEYGLPIQVAVKLRGFGLSVTHWMECCCPCGKSREIHG